MALITVYTLVRDGGDGSASVAFFRDKDTVCRILDNDFGRYDEFTVNEGDSTDFQVEETGCTIQFDDDEYPEIDEDDEEE